jgi:hypothetical protein
VNLSSASACLEEANALNAESRQTFALVSDLTTFVHVADLMRIDLRSRPSSISLIELKSGKVNKMLLERLEAYRSEPEALEEVKHDPRLDPRYLPQALRMLKQRIRLHDVTTTIRTDKGRDIVSGVPIRLTGPEKSLFYYDECLAELCKKATDGIASLTIQEVIHLGAGFADDRVVAGKRAVEGLTAAIYAQASRANRDQKQVKKETLSLIAEEQSVLQGDLLGANLLSMANRPFLLWEIGRDHKVNLVSRRLRLLYLFDLSYLIWLGREMGLDIGLSSRSEGAKAARIHGRNAQLWGGRLLQIRMRGEKVFLLGRAVSQVVCGLCSPTSVLHARLAGASRLRAAPASYIFS